MIQVKLDSEIKYYLTNMLNQVELPSTAKIHPVLHISQLKPFKGEIKEPYIPLPLVTSEIGPVLLPKAILKTRLLLRGNTQVRQVLIMWMTLKSQVLHYMGKC